MIESTLVHTVAGEKSGMNGGGSINIYTPPCVKEMAGEKLLYNTGSQLGVL